MIYAKYSPSNSCFSKSKKNNTEKSTAKKRPNLSRDQTLHRTIDFA